MLRRPSMRWKMHPTAMPAGPAAALVEETELFLDGGYLGLALAETAEIPAWIWLSTLAHGDDDSLRFTEQWGAVYGGTRPEYNTWGRVLQRLARMVNDLTETGKCSLAELQRDLFVPLE